MCTGTSHKGLELHKQTVRYRPVTPGAKRVVVTLESGSVCVCIALSKAAARAPQRAVVLFMHTPYASGWPPESMQAAYLAACRRLLHAAAAQGFSTAQPPPILPSSACLDEMVTMFTV